ncbi:hypothetical protein [Halomonas alkalicola]|uniref:Uncharacterized protein n=1 Tax=Halomonas alkalicola TaxID=1930622 RepID=A0ABY9H643_9GAMM|nr:hypothetical protein [Halomonas alkalicola]WLI73743.1 hypothetical protein B6N23_02030 [Halomonas alkalicola]
MHSSSGVDLLASQRVTGVAREPSFFVPFVVDFIILTLILVASLLKRYIIIAFAVLLLLLSLSPSGYMILFGSVFGALVIVFLRTPIRTRHKIQHVLYFIRALSLFLAFYFSFVDTPSFYYVYKRFTSLDVSSSSRFYMVVMPFYWMLDSSVFTFLFGNGIKTYSIIGTEFFLPDGSPVHVTSNNFFVDTFWGSGLIGLVVLISFFHTFSLNCSNQVFQIIKYLLPQ